MKIDIGKVAANPRQPRKNFDHAELDGLAETMSAVGLIQPIVVEQHASEAGMYVLVDGERRLRAARQLGWNVIEAVIRPSSNHNGAQRLIESVVANEQHAEMNAMERATAYSEMLAELGSVTEIGRLTGRSDVVIYSYLALLEFEPSIQRIFRHGGLPVSSKVITTLRRMDRATRERMATSAAVHGLSERVFVAMAKKYEQRAINPKPKRAEPDEELPVRSGEKFDALNLVRKMLPELAIEPARATCRACDLSDMANATTCRQCPLVDFLRRL